MAALRAMMRGFSYLYHFILALFLLGVCLVALTTRQQLQLRMLPWQGTDLTYWLLGGSLVGLLSVLLAIARKFRLLFFLWSLVVLAVILRGFFFSPYHFAGKPSFYRALLLACGALLAVFGAWSQMRRRPVR